MAEYDEPLFCLLTMNHPLHPDANFAQESTEFKRNVVVGNHI